MSLLVLLCNEVAPVVRLLVPNTGSNACARKRIVDCFAFKYYGILFNLLKLYRSKHMYEPAPPLLEGPWKGLICKKTELISQWKKWAIYKNLDGISDWKDSNYLKSKYTISGCRFLLDECSYGCVFTVLLTVFRIQSVSLNTAQHHSILLDRALKRSPYMLPLGPIKSEVKMVLECSFQG